MPIGIARRTCLLSPHVAQPLFRTVEAEGPECCCSSNSPLVLSVAEVLDQGLPNPKGLEAGARLTRLPPSMLLKFLIMDCRTRRVGADRGDTAELALAGAPGTDR
jgi:hypothetical protein